MILSLDSSVVVDLLRGEPERAEVRTRFDAARSAGVQLKLSTVALYELAYGARRSGKAEARLDDLHRLLGYVEVAPFEGEDAMTAGGLRNDLAPGRGVETPDLLIASQAFGREWALVTSNIRHFARFKGLTLYDWRVSDQPLDRTYITTRLLGRTEDK